MNTTRIVSIMAAMTENNVIGMDNNIPWNMPSDMNHFREKTIRHCIIMGKNTQQGLGFPLDRRINIVVTRDMLYNVDGFIVEHTMKDAIDHAEDLSKKYSYPPSVIQELFVIGGQIIYEQALPIADKLYLTKIYTECKGDVFFPDLNVLEWKETNREDHDADLANPYPYTFFEYERIR